jgi:hypothetical protein
MTDPAPISVPESHLIKTRMKIRILHLLRIRQPLFLRKLNSFYLTTAHFGNSDQI